MPKISRPPPQGVPSAPKPQTAALAGAAKPSAPLAPRDGFATQGPARQGKGAPLGLPITSAVVPDARMHGAVGIALAFQLARLWKRRPGEKRIPKKALKTLMAALPKWPDDDDGPLEEGDVKEYCDALNRRPSKQSNELMAGVSGAQVFELVDEDGEGTIFKKFVSAEEMLQDVVALEIIAALPGNPLKAVAIEHAGALGEAGDHGYVLMEKAKGTVLYDRLDALAAAKAPERESVLTLLCEELRCIGAALAKFHQAGCSGELVPDGYKRTAMKTVRGLYESACEKAKQGPLTDAATRTRIDAGLRAVGRELMKASLPGTIVIGDVHPGNVAVKNGECTVFDVSTLVASLGAKGEGIAPAADDSMWFAETLAWYGRKIGLTEGEVHTTYVAFLDAYRANSPLSAAADEPAAARRSRLRSRLLDLRAAPDSADAVERVLEVLESK